MHRERGAIRAEVSQRGSDVAEKDGIRATKALLERVREELEVKA